MTNQEASQDNREPQLEDIGTRYEHLKEYADALLACADILDRRGLNSTQDKEKYIKFKIAAELAQHTIDNFAGYKDVRTEYSLYRLLNDIPDKGEQVEGGRGTPLKL